MNIIRNMKRKESPRIDESFTDQQWNNTNNPLYYSKDKLEKVYGIFARYAKTSQMKRRVYY